MSVPSVFRRFKKTLQHSKNCPFPEWRVACIIPLVFLRRRGRVVEGGRLESV